jgi:hypothetical protein
MRRRLSYAWVGHSANYAVGSGSNCVPLDLHHQNCGAGPASTASVGTERNAPSVLVSSLVGVPGGCATIDNIIAGECDQGSGCRRAGYWRGTPIHGRRGLDRRHCGLLRHGGFVVNLDYDSHVRSYVRIA